MTYELEALERQGMIAEINCLKQKLAAMEADWRECARTGKSYCFCCKHDDTCTCTNDADCNFTWQSRNTENGNA